MDGISKGIKRGVASNVPPRDERNHTIPLMENRQQTGSYVRPAKEHLEEKVT